MFDDKSKEFANQGSGEMRPPENLTKEVMLCLSKEMETATNNMMVFRTRIGFGLLVGPFLLLGSFVVGAKGQPISFNLRWYGWVALVIVAICFLGIAVIAARIEVQAWEQCNRWRELIVALRRDPSLEIKKPDLELPNDITRGYLVGYLLLFLSVIAAVIIIKNVGTTEPSIPSRTGVTSRLEQVFPLQHVNDPSTPIPH